MRVVPVRSNSRDRGPARFPRTGAVLLVGVAMVLLLAGAAQAQTDTTATTAVGPSTTSSAPSATTQTSAAPQAPAGSAGLIPPNLGLAPLNPGLKTGQMVVQIWPEYDKKAVLVIMNFDLPAEVPLPATFKFAVPTGAVIAGIGEVDANNNFTFNYANSYPPVQAGTDWDIATVQVQKYRKLQIDYYYDPGFPVGAGARSFPVLMQVPLDASSLNLHVQEPARATDFNVQPALQGTGPAQDGFTYSVAAFSDVKAGSTFGYLVSYSKPDGDLSTTSSSQPASTKLGTRTVLLAAILVIVVIVGGFVIYRLYRRGSKTPPAKVPGRQTPRPSPARPPAAVKKQKPVVQAERVTTDQGQAETGEAVTGEEDAGKTVTGQCPACGEDLVENARFCPSCGEAQGS